MSGRERDGVTTTVENPSHRKIKRARVSTDGEDFISSLPDAILQHMFSLIPTKIAIRTSVLSKRWRHVWSETPSLNIDCYNYNPNSVTKTLARHYSAPKITSFNITISTKAKQIKSLIELAVSRNTEKLSLRFHYSTFAYKFPEVFFTSFSSLKHLFIESGTMDMIPRHVTLSWRSLKTLSLRFCVLPDEACAKILSGSPLLESLTLCCDQLERLDLSMCVKLKRLDLEIQGSNNPIKIVAPHLQCLNLSHSDASQCDLVDVSSLTQAKVNVYCPISRGFIFDDFGDPATGLADSFQIMILATLEKLQSVERLTLCGAFCLQILSLALLCGAPFPTFKVEALTIETAFYHTIIPGVAKLLQNSPRLKTVKLDIVDCNNVIEERRLVNYLYYKGLYPRQWLEPKHLDDPSFSEPKLMASVMNFLLNTSGDDKVGCYTFSQDKNSIYCHGLNSRLLFRH